MGPPEYVRSSPARFAQFGTAFKTNQYPQTGPRSSCHEGPVIRCCSPTRTKRSYLATLLTQCTQRYITHITCMCFLEHSRPAAVAAGYSDFPLIATKFPGPHFLVQHIKFTGYSDIFARSRWPHHIRWQLHFKLLYVHESKWDCTSFGCRLRRHSTPRRFARRILARRPLTEPFRSLSCPFWDVLRGFLTMDLPSSIPFKMPSIVDRL